MKPRGVHIKFISLFILSVFFGSNIFAVAQSGGEPKRRFTSRGNSISEMEQAKKEGLFKFYYSGYIRLDAFLDSRQTVDFWKGIDLTYPKNRALDAVNDDINDKGQFNMVPFGQLAVKVVGPEVWDAKTSALFKTDCAGKSGDGLDNFANLRFKHGYFNLEWDKTELIAGVDYSPLVLRELCADTVSVNAGEFFDPFDYSSMVRVRHRVDPMEFVFAISKRFWFEEVRNSVAPGLYAQANVHVRDQLFCAGVDFQSMVPRLHTELPVTNENGYREWETINSFIAFLGANLTKDNVRFKTRLTYAENPLFYTLLGGYAACTWDSETDRRHYTNIRSANFWMDLSHLTEEREIGIFFGYAENLGSRNSLATIDGMYNVVGEGFDAENGTGIDYAFRVQPRVRFFKGPITIGFEIDHTRVQYGTITDCGRANQDTCVVSNTRFVASIVYSF